MSSSTTKVCFNSSCKVASEKWSRGWRRRTGEYAHLCDRCSSAFEDGKFCETFHLNASGWRCCESCGKQIHCGCIVSFHMFVLLDAGGIECLTCAKKSYILTPNPAWPPPLHFLASKPERMKDLSVKTWSSIAGSGPVPWRQAPSLSHRSDIQSTAQLTPFEIDVSGSTDRYRVCDRLSTASPEMTEEYPYERLFIEKLRIGPCEALQNGNTGHTVKEQPYPVVNDIKPVFPKIEFSSTLNLASASSSKIEADDAQLASIISEPSAISISVGRQCCSLSGMGSCGDPPICSGKAQGDNRGQNQLFSRYRPRMTDEELQQISGDSKSVITPLFEKMLSASDAGRIGRLVLPKKCAEAYFPPITLPEGVPLKVQDMRGKEWVFQYRFWPNNNSRMYVLEGITPCIQSMQLQAGDVVTFSRLEPEGKLVMGGRKASAISFSDQGDVVTTVGSDALNQLDGGAGNKCRDAISVNGNTKEKMLDDKPITHSKRKNNSFGVKSKRLRIVNDDVIKFTWTEAQILMRPPAKIVPSIIVVEGCEFEEFKEAAPVMGRPTIPGIDNFGSKIQWVQCEDCFKWRKVPANALLPSRWTCSDNVWDLDRSQCSSAEELTKEQLEHMLTTTNKDSSQKEETTKHDTDLLVSLEGLDALANLAIEGENKGLPSSFENRTKHPRHKPACTCIVCLQPPSGKGSKHEQPCDCVVCSSLKRRFRTLMERRERKQLEKEAETSSQNLQLPQLPKNVQDLDKSSNLDEPNGAKSSTSPQKGQIDLNIQPERDEDLSPGSISGGRVTLLGCDIIGNLVGKQMQQDGIGGVNLVSCVALDGGHPKTG